VPFCPLLTEGGRVCAESIDDSKFWYFGEYRYTFGFVGKGGLEGASLNGKIFMRPSVTGAIGLNDAFNGIGLSVGGEYLDVAPMDWWEKRFHEKDFTMRTSNLYFGVSPRGWQEKGETKFITTGICSVYLRPPSFNSKGLLPSEISEKQAEFENRQSAWGQNVIKRTGIEIGRWTISRGEVSEEYNGNSDTKLRYIAKDVFAISLVYIDKHIGVKIKRRGRQPLSNSPIKIDKNFIPVVYFTPISFLGTFDFFYLNKRMWYFNYSMFGIYF